MNMQPKKTITFLFLIVLLSAQILEYSYSICYFCMRDCECVQNHYEHSSDSCCQEDSEEKTDPVCRYFCGKICTSCATITSKIADFKQTKKLALDICLFLSAKTFHKPGVEFSIQKLPPLICSSTFLSQILRI